ncbi:hypothetical protein BX666DRAFT_1964506 [Dichotomocladium elegans]|nr:hypothetical protein BX666DRAFT_1964506 [Dichotomocladium elegans]
MDSSRDRPTYSQDRRLNLSITYQGNRSPLNGEMPPIDMDALKEAFLCQICVDFYVIPYTLECGHTFCSACILNWLGRRRTCPHCRANINSRPVPAFTVHNQVNTVRSMIFGHQVTNDNEAIRIAQQEFEAMYPNARASNFIRDEQDNV